jgi:L-ascorbate metabolism protein UlaG (beta-lactamase superfamily)
MKDLNFCHLGDLGHLLDEKTAKGLQPVDILFVPVGGVFTIDAAQAWKVIRSLEPKVVIPMHYKTGGLSLSIQPIDPFLSLAGDVSVVKIGNEIDFDQSDVPNNLTIWEFSQ